MRSKTFQIVLLILMFALLCGLANKVTGLESELREVRKELKQEQDRAKSMEQSLDYSFRNLVYYVDNGTGVGG